MPNIGRCHNMWVSVRTINKYVPIIKIPNIWGRIKMWTCVDNFLSEKNRTYCQR